MCPAHNTTEQTSDTQETPKLGSSIPHKQDAPVAFAVGTYSISAAKDDPASNGEVFKGDMPPTPKVQVQAQAETKYPTKAKDNLKTQAPEQTDTKPNSEPDHVTVLQKIKDDLQENYPALSKEEIDSIVSEQYDSFKNKTPPIRQAFREALAENEFDSAEEEQSDSTSPKTYFEDEKDLLAEQLTTTEIETCVSALTPSDEDEISDYEIDPKNPKEYRLKSKIPTPKKQDAKSDIPTQEQDAKLVKPTSEILTQVNEYKAYLADELSERYETGSEDASPDKWKANKFRRISIPATKKLPDTRLKTSYFYERLGTLTSLRLGALRINRVFDDFGKGSALFSKINSILSLSYGLTLLIDLGMLIKNTWGTKKQRQNTTAWTRLKNAFYKDGRNTRMANDSVWFAINLACFWLTGGVSAWLNLSLFVFDVFVDIYKYVKTKSKYEGLFKKIDAKIVELTKELDDPEKPLDANSRVNNEKLIKKYNYIRLQLEANEKSEKKLKRYALIITTVILVGMLCIFLPPVGATLGLTISAAIAKPLFITGAFLAVSGSIFGSFTKKLVQECKDIYNGIASLLEKRRATKVKVSKIASTTSKISQSLTASTASRASCASTWDKTRLSEPTLSKEQLEDEERILNLQKDAATMGRDTVEIEYPDKTVEKYDERYRNNPIGRLYNEERELEAQFEKDRQVQDGSCGSLKYSDMFKPAPRKPASVPSSSFVAPYFQPSPTPNP